MVAPVVVFVEGSELIGWTELSLQRSKDELTGALEIGIFMGHIPNAPVVANAAHGREITVYIGGNLAFIGTIDKRIGTGARHGKGGTTVNDGSHGSSSVVSSDGNSRSVNIGPNEYTVKLQARGKLKVLIDSSHQHPTTNMLKPTDKVAVGKLLEPWGIETIWIGQVNELDKIRFRDGARVVDELARISRENCHFMYETRDGKLRVTDDVGPDFGEELILGINIQQFSAEQSEDGAKRRIKVKGQRTKKDVRGEDAVLKTITEVEDHALEADIPTIVQQYGDATPESRERRARFEANKRSSASKNLTIEVFHVQSTNGDPWDVGTQHYVEVPPEGIFNVFECTALTYTVQNDSELKTTLTLAPPPKSGATGGSDGPLGSLPEVLNDFEGIGAARRSAAGVTFSPGLYPQPWSGPVLSILATPFVAVAAVATKLFAGVDGGTDKPKTNTPLKLPADYQSKQTNANGRGTR